MVSEAFNITELINFLNSSGGIPLVVKTTTETTPYQFWINIFLAVLGSIFVLALIFFFIKSFLFTFLIKVKLYFLKLNTKRHMLIIKHSQEGLFSQSMINEKTMQGIIKGLTKFKGKPFDLVVHSPGGSIFHTLFIARLFQNYPGEIRAIVPYYAMSGGTILSLAADKIGMGKNACLGPVDPQLGSLFKIGSAEAWNRIVKLKGKKAEDSSINFAFMGKQYTKTIREVITELIQNKITKENIREIVNLLTSGKIEHAYQITPTLLKNYGFDIEILDEKLLELFNKIIISKSFEGVIYQ